MTRNCIFIAVFMLISFSAFPQSPTDNTPHCVNEGIGFATHQLILNTDSSTQSRIFLIHNTSPGTVILNHQKNTPGGGAGWMSHIDKDRWSAMGMSESNFPLSCMLYAPPKLVLTDCQNVVTACALPSKNPPGNYWLVENKFLTDVIKSLEQKALLSPEG